MGWANGTAGASDQAGGSAPPNEEEVRKKPGKVSRREVTGEGDEAEKKGASYRLRQEGQQL